ncbi:MAG: transposase [Trichodesmium sp. MAG_R03]|nr:transposase [Trichodesmium sp. MAG_R03]
MSKRCRILEMWMYVSALSLESGELLSVVSVRLGVSAIQDYGRRWQIETLFGCLKSRGFDLESTHITEPERLTKMIFLLTLTLCLAHRVGIWFNEHGPLLAKKRGRKAQSFFAMV